MQIQNNLVHRITGSIDELVTPICHLLLIQVCFASRPSVKPSPGIVHSSANRPSYTPYRLILAFLLLFVLRHCLILVWLTSIPSSVDLLSVLL